MFKRRRPGHVFVRRKADNKETVMEREDMVKSERGLRGWGGRMDSPMDTVLGRFRALPNSARTFSLLGSGVESYLQRVE